MSDQNPLAIYKIEGTNGPIILQQSVDNPANVLKLIDGTTRKRAMDRAAGVDINDTMAILDFGLDAQEQVSAISQKMIAGIRIKDMGNTPVSAEITKLNAAWAQVNPHPIILSAGQFFGGLSAKIKAWVKGYELVTDHIKGVRTQIETYKATARTDIQELDHLDGEANKLATYAKETEASCLYLLVRLAKKYDTDRQIIKVGDENALFNLQMLGDVIGQIDQRRFTAFATRGEVKLTRSQIKMIQSMDMNLYGALTTKLLFSLPKMERDLALMAKLLQAEKSADYLKQLTDMEERRSRQVGKRLGDDAKAVALLTNDAARQMVQLVDAYDSHMKVLDDVREIQNKGADARRKGEEMINHVQTSLDQKVANFTPNQNLGLPDELVQAAKSEN